MTSFVLMEPFVTALLAALSSFIVCALTYPFYIKWLRDKQIQQFIRKEGPAAHAAKSKTPTMGGLCFMVVIPLVSLVLLWRSGLPAQNSIDAIKTYLVLGTAFACGLLGLADDFGKVTSRSNKGISGKLRLACEFGLGLLIGASLLLFQTPIEIILGFNLKDANAVVLTHLPKTLELLYMFVLVPFIMAATSNALNLHDGMDGLCGGTSFLVFCSFVFMLLFVSHCESLVWISSAAAGAMLAFLIFNRNPARIFMGDTGSLFIGALMAGIVVFSGLTLWFIPLALIYIVETLSVMAQVAYFKLTKPHAAEINKSGFSLLIYKLTHKLPGEGKRLFRMAPIHHHFESLAAEKGMKEWEVVALFWFAQFCICCLTIIAFHRVYSG